MPHQVSEAVDRGDVHALAEIVEHRVERREVEWIA